MSAIPSISKSDLLAILSQQYPDAEVQAEDLNPKYGSWEIEVRRGEAEVHIFWGPLSGFGGTDINHTSDNPDLFRPFDVGLVSIKEAVAFVGRIIGAQSACDARRITPVSRD